jgi:hypothetical protein
MKKYLLPQSGNFYKANLHCHTTYSDGRKTPEQIKELYKKLGYSIVAYTDHDILVSHSELSDDSFLALNGFEVEIDEPEVNKYGYRKCCHICFVGLEPDNVIQPCWNRERYVWGNALSHKPEVKIDETQPDYVRRFGSEGISDIMNKCREKGFFVTYNHPSWSLEDYSDYMGYKGMHAFEMFNGGCIAEGYDDYNPRVYDDILRSGNKIYCIGADDNHNARPEDSRRYDSGWAWTVIKADKLEYRTITKALEDGSFYASEGPEIYDLWYEDGKVHVTCSDADRICCNYKIRHAEMAIAEGDQPLREATFVFKPEWGYFRITVIDKNGKHACTNAYFAEDICE